jgi:hypothetical protein
MLKKSIKYCTKCNHPCILEQNDGSVYEYKILTIIKKSKEVISFGNNYLSEINKDFLCLNCSSYTAIKCSNCGDLFDINSTTSAYDDYRLKKPVDVCLQCYTYEACDTCGYLGGSSPCRWCRCVI